MNENYEEALRLFRAGHFPEALRCFSKALKERETSHGWNNWATAVERCGYPEKAEKGYRRALELDPRNSQAAANCGILLAQSARLSEAISFLARSLWGLDRQQRPAVEKLLRQCVSSAAQGMAAAQRGPESALGEQDEDATPLIYFLHIPKTAGTSFYRFLVSAFGEARVSPQMLWDALPAYSSAAKNWKVWSGHFGGLLPFILRSWPRIITLLRDPTDRTLSHINHVQRDAGHPLHPYAQGLSILDYCRHPKLRRSVSNYQARFLASLSFALAIFKTPRDAARATSALAFEDALFSLDQQYDLLESAIRAMSEMDMVGIAEAHHRTLKLFARKFNVPAPIEPFYENKAGESQRQRTDLSAEELECIRELTEIDQLVYEHARKRFELDCRTSLGIVPCHAPHGIT
jgi:tetratricopeptide (TPR) repeat protein